MKVPRVEVLEGVAYLLALVTALRVALVAHQDESAVVA
jgi:hypothetical protein